MEPEILFFMIVRQFRLMLGEERGELIEETKRMAPWQASKIRNQVRSFGKEKLNNSYNKLFETDLFLKTGRIPYSLEKSIDFFLLDL
jgi:DNA polymerase III delta subunit